MLRLCRSGEEVFESIDGGRDRIGVTAAHKKSDGNSVPLVEVHDAFVSPFQSVACEAQSSQRVFGESVHSRLEKNEIIIFRAERIESLVETFEVIVIADMVCQRHVEITLVFTEREVALAMN